MSDLLLERPKQIEPNGANTQQGLRMIAEIQIGKTQARV
jgi:hypothetical protein